MMRVQKFVRVYVTQTVLYRGNLSLISYLVVAVVKVLR